MSILMPSLYSEPLCMARRVLTVAHPKAQARLTGMSHLVRIRSLPECPSMGVFRLAFKRRQPMLGSSASV